MPKPPRFAYTKTAAGWKVDCPPSLSGTGRRERRFFPSRDAAKAHAQTLRAQFLEHGRGAVGIAPAVAADAVKARALLDGAGLAEETFVALARAAIAERQRSDKSALMHEATAAWLEATAGLAPATTAAYRYAGRRLNAGLPGRRLASIQPEEIFPALGIDGATGAAARKLFVSFRVFARWCAEPPREWLDAGHLLARITAPTAATEGEIETLPPEALAALLRTAEARFPALVGWLAVQAFAGVRVAEACRLRPGDVSADGIELAAHVTKTGLRRHLEPNATLQAWLRAYPFQPTRANGPEVRALRRLAGWQVESPLLPEPPAATRGKWPQNCLRHSYASAAVALNDPPLEKLIFSFGHVGATVALLRRHYVGRMTRETAKAYFAILPVENPAP